MKNILTGLQTRITRELLLDDPVKTSTFIVLFTVLAFTPFPKGTGWSEVLYGTLMISGLVYLAFDFGVRSTKITRQPDSATPQHGQTEEPQ